MKGEQAMEIFNLVKAKKMLPTKLDELVPLSFIGELAVKFAKEKFDLMEKLNMADAQRKATLKDGQGAGELLLTIEGRIGDIASKEPDAKGIPVKAKGGALTGMKPSGKKPKHERLKMNRHRMQQSQQISKHPEIVEKVKAQAKENEDIPTKTAVLSEIKYQKEKVRRKKSETFRNNKTKLQISIEESVYVTALDRCATVLPSVPPKTWSEGGFQMAKAKANIIIKRLEVFNG